MDTNLISTRREEEGYGSFQFHNLTGVLERRFSDAIFQPASGKINVTGSLVDSLDWSLEMDRETKNGVHQEPEEQEKGVNQEPEEPQNSGENNLEAVYEEGSNELEQESEGGEVT
ncbi:hypothetical protein YC2023_052615 [Brassica napus]